MNKIYAREGLGGKQESEAEETRGGWKERVRKGEKGKGMKDRWRTAQCWYAR